MSALYCPNFIELDQETLDDFTDCFQDSVDDIDLCVKELELAPDSPEKLNQLFRVLHTLKGNLNMCFLDPLVEIAHEVEQVIDDIRAGNCQYHCEFGELINISVHQLGRIIQALLTEQTANHNVVNLVLASWQALMNANANDRPMLADEATTQLAGIDPLSYAREPCDEESPSESPTSSDQYSPEHRAQQLNFLRNLAQQLDNAIEHRLGRSPQELEIALSVNDKLGQPIDPQQLEAAVYAHDLGMAFIPHALINKNSQYSTEDIRQVRAHIYVGRNMLHQLGGWQLAEQLIQQHHERYDGSGYPQRLKGEQIHTGAAIIALADAYCSITRQRADRTFKKSLLKAVQEINSHTGTKFDPKLVEIFNQSVRELYVKAKS